jgi:hypothetical protein
MFTHLRRKAHVGCAHFPPPPAPRPPLTQKRAAGAGAVGSRPRLLCAGEGPHAGFGHRRRHRRALMHGVAPVGRKMKRAWHMRACKQQHIGSPTPC